MLTNRRIEDLSVSGVKQKICHSFVSRRYQCEMSFLLFPSEKGITKSFVTFFDLKKSVRPLIMIKKICQSLLPICQCNQI